MVDLFIGLYLLRSLYLGWRRGAVTQVIAIISTALIFLAALYAYQRVGTLSYMGVELPALLVKTLTYCAVIFSSIIVQTIIGYLMLKFAPSSKASRGEGSNVIDKFFGSFFGVINGALWTMAIVFFLFMLPVASMTADIERSVVANAFREIGNYSYTTVVGYLYPSLVSGKGGVIAYIDSQKKQFKVKVKFD